MAQKSIRCRCGQIFRAPAVAAGEGGGSIQDPLSAGPFGAGSGLLLAPPSPGNACSAIENEPSPALHNFQSALPASPVSNPYWRRKDPEVIVTRLQKAPEKKKEMIATDGKSMFMRLAGVALAILGVGILALLGMTANSDQEVSGRTRGRAAFAGLFCLVVGVLWAIFGRRMTGEDEE